MRKLMIILIDVKIDKILHIVIKKTILSKEGTEENFFNLLRLIYGKKTTGNIVLNEMLTVFTLTTECTAGLRQ